MPKCHRVSKQDPIACICVCVCLCNEERDELEIYLTLSRFSPKQTLNFSRLKFWTNCSPCGCNSLGAPPVLPGYVSESAASPSTFLSPSLWMKQPFKVRSPRWPLLKFSGCKISLILLYSEGVGPFLVMLSLSFLGEIDI